MVRFTVWMTLGLIMYFYYGITHSSLENPSEEIELTIDQSYLKPQPQQNKNTNHYDNQTPTAVWDRHGYENKMAEDSWSTSVPVQNNYTTNSWDISDLNSAWNEPNPQNQSISSGSSSKPAIPSRSSTSKRVSTSKSKPPPPPRPTKQPSVQRNESKSGFSGIFVDETQFPDWDD